MAKSKKTTDDLSVVEKFYIENHCSKLTLESICTDLNREQENVEAYYNECLDRQKSADTIDKLMIVNSKKGYAIMSREASERSETKKRSETNSLSEHIHRIRKNK
jgi:hypothetical protein